MAMLLWLMFFVPAPDSGRPIIRDASVSQHLVVHPNSGRPIIRQDCCR